MSHWAEALGAVRQLLSLFVNNVQASVTIVPVATEAIVMELQQLALSKTGDPTELLRKGLLVATKLQLQDFRLWLTKELKGYPDDDVPDYRKVRCELRLKNPYRGLIPIVFEDTQISDILCNVNVGAPISSLHELVRADEGGVITMPLHPDQESALLRMQDPIGRLPPVRTVSRNQIVRIIDAVYNAVLEWALQLEAEGIVGEGMSFLIRKKRRPRIAQKYEFRISKEC